MASVRVAHARTSARGVVHSSSGCILSAARLIEGEGGDAGHHQPQGFGLSGTEFGVEFRLSTMPGLVGRVEQQTALIGQLDDLFAPIGRFGDASYQAGFLQGPEVVAKTRAVHRKSVRERRNGILAAFGHQGENHELRSSKTKGRELAIVKAGQVSAGPADHRAVAIEKRRRCARRLACHD